MSLLSCAVVLYCSGPAPEYVGLLRDMGADLQAVLSEQAQYLVFDGATTPVKFVRAASLLDINVVSPEWVVKCHTSRRLISPEKYLVSEKKALEAVAKAEAEKVETQKRGSSSAAPRRPSELDMLASYNKSPPSSGAGGGPSRRLGTLSGSTSTIDRAPKLPIGRNHKSMALAETSAGAPKLPVNKYKSMAKSNAVTGSKRKRLPDAMEEDDDELVDDDGTPIVTRVVMCASVEELERIQREEE